jgi:hypothetical protein
MVDLDMAQGISDLLRDGLLIRSRYGIILRSR